MTYTEKAQNYESGSFRAYSRDLERQDDEAMEAERLAQEAEERAMEEPLDTRIFEHNQNAVHMVMRAMGVRR